MQNCQQDYQDIVYDEVFKSLKKNQANVKSEENTQNINNDQMPPNNMENHRFKNNISKKIDNTSNEKLDNTSNKKLDEAYNEKTVEKPKIILKNSNDKKSDDKKKDIYQEIQTIDEIGKDTQSIKGSKIQNMVKDG